MATTPVQPIAGNTHVSASFGKLLEPGLRKIFFEVYKELPEQYSKIFNILTSQKAVEHDWGMGALGDWTKRADEFAVVDYGKVSAGLDRTYTHSAYTKGFMIGRELYDDDQYNQIEKLPKSLARGCRAFIEKDSITLLQKAFATTAIYDTKFLCSAVHPLLDSVKTCSNLLPTASPLNKANLEKAITLMRGTLDEAGNVMVITPKKLIVSPALEFTARTLLETDLVPGSNNNDINTIKGRLELVVMDYLGSQGGGSDTAWFILSDEHELNFFWRVKPEFKWDEDFDTFIAKYRGYMRYSYGVSDWRGIVGSTGV